MKAAIRGAVLVSVVAFSVSACGSGPTASNGSDSAVASDWTAVRQVLVLDGDFETATSAADIPRLSNADTVIVGSVRSSKEGPTAFDENGVEIMKTLRLDVKTPDGRSVEVFAPRVSTAGPSEIGKLDWPSGSVVIAADTLSSGETASFFKGSDVQGEALIAVNPYSILARGGDEWVSLTSDAEVDFLGGLSTEQVRKTLQSSSAEK